MILLLLLDANLATVSAFLRTDLTAPAALLVFRFEAHLSPF